MCKAVAIFLTTSQGTVYLNQRLNTPTYTGFWQNAGGKIDPGEHRLLAAQRELLEETGLFIKPHRFRKLGTKKLVHADGSPYSVTTYKVQLLPHEIPQNLEHEKHGPWKNFPISEVTTLQPKVPAIAHYLSALSTPS